MALFRNTRSAVVWSANEVSIAAETEAKASTEPATVHAAEAWTGVIAFVASVVVAAYALPDSTATFTPPDGVAAFAVFYVIAFAVERLVEFLDAPIEWVLKKVGSRDSKSELERERDAAVADALTGESDGADAANAQKEVDGAAKSRSAAIAGVAAGLGAIAAHLFNADFLSAVGVTGNFAEWLPLSITGLVVAGGSKQLHDLMSNVSKSAQSKKTPEETSKGK